MDGEIEHNVIYVTNSEEEKQAFKDFYEIKIESYSDYYIIYKNN